MARVTVYHLTLPKRLPLIEEDGLQTRATTSSLYGPPGDLDAAAPGTFANGKRVSGWASEGFAKDQVGTLGGGFTSYTVDPGKTLAARAADRAGDPEAYWETAKPLKDWLDDGDLPDDLEVHQNVAVRAKHVRLHAPLLGEDELGAYASLVAAVADEDRLSAKALMHLAIIACDTDFDSEHFKAACALAWRDEPDPSGLMRELTQVGPDNVASAALAEFGGSSPELTTSLRQVLEETREWADEHGMDHGQGLYSRSAVILDELPNHVAGDG